MAQTKTVYKYDTKGFYLRPIVLDETDKSPSGVFNIPARCTSIQPPAAKTGYAIVFERGGWTYKRLRDKTHAAGDVAYSSRLPGDLYLECMSAGQTAAVAPDLSAASIGDEIADGTVVWIVRKKASTADLSEHNANNAAHTAGIAGNAGTATKFKTERKISIAGDATGSVGFDGSADAVINVNVVDSEKLGGAAAALYAKNNSPSLTGTPTAPTAAKGAKNQQIANTKFVAEAIADLIASAPGALDTLNELAAAINDDPNFATTMTNLIATKAPLNNAALTGAPTAPTAAKGAKNQQIANTKFVADAIADLIASAPGALDTLNELAAAINDDPNFATTMTNLIATKAPLNNAALTGAPTVPTPVSTDSSTRIANTRYVKEQMAVPDKYHTLKRSQAYAVGDVAYSRNLPTWARLDCTTAGTTAAAEPAWGNVAVGQQLTDGTVKWTVRDIKNALYAP